MVLAMRASKSRVKNNLANSARFFRLSNGVVPAISEQVEIRARLKPWLKRSDPLADQAIEELSRLPHQEQSLVIRELVRNQTAKPSNPNLIGLTRLYEQATSMAQSFETEATQKAGAIFFRAGALGGLTLGLRSLVYGYADPRGNKPLVYTGQLESMAARRLAETGKFVTAVCSHGGMKPEGAGFHAALHVRLMHARVRFLLRENPAWNQERWGVPINQHDMLATTLLFSNIFMEGIQMLGVQLGVQERENFQALWVQIGAVMGVDTSLMPQSFNEAQGISQAIRAGQESADDDSRNLVRALLDQPLRVAKTKEERLKARRQVAIAETLACELLDEQLVADLQLQQSKFSLVTGIRRAIQPLELIRRITGLDSFVESRGERYWEKSIELGLVGVQELFPLPLRLYGERAFIPV